MTDYDRPMPLEHGDTCTCLWVVDHGETHHEPDRDCPIHWAMQGETQ